MMGNHDDRALLRQHLTLPKGAMTDFIQYEIETPNGVIICLDTHKIGSAAGELCPKRLAWLHNALERSAPKNVYIFMHHPPLALKLPAQDEIMLEDASGFLDLISASGNVKHLFLGHVHRQTAGSVRGIPFATLGSLSFQAPQPRPAWNWDSFIPAQEAPQYGVLHIESGTAVLQYTQFCDHSLGRES